MIEKTVYECEYCGKAFSDKKDCIAHELIEDYQDLKALGANVIFWDERGKRINKEEAIRNFDKEVYAVRVEKEEEENIFKWLEDAGEQLGFYTPWNYGPYLAKRSGATYVFNEHEDEWVNAEDELTKRKEAVADWEDFVMRLN